jgi:hypothetical protein
MRDIQSEIAVLQALEDRLEELMALIPERPPIASVTKAKLKRLYTSLKTDMRGMVKQRSSLGDVVAEALCRMSAATNTDPIRSDWHDGLYQARDDVRHAKRSRQRT